MSRGENKGKGDNPEEVSSAGIRFLRLIAIVALFADIHLVLLIYSWKVFQVSL